MDIRIFPRKLSGSVTPPPSKALTHRLLLAAGLAQGVSTLHQPALARDTQATIDCLNAMGAKITAQEDGALRIVGRGPSRGHDAVLPPLDCGVSASTLRYLMPVSLALAGGGVFRGSDKLMARTLQPYLDLFVRKGILCDREGNTITLQGRLVPGDFTLSGSVSSQFYTGLLFALPLLDGPSRIHAETPVESKDYIRMTLDVLKRSGVKVQASEDLADIAVTPSHFHPVSAEVEADWSQAAFWYAAAFLDNAVQPQGLLFDSLQGDKAVSNFYWTLARPGDVELSLVNHPDLALPLAVMAAVRSGNTRFTGAGRLRLKESDRLAGTAALLNALGGEAEALEDTLVIHGGRPLVGGTVDSAGDHRLVMAAAIAATACTAPVTILGAEAVEKSYPDFFRIYTRLGGKLELL